MQPWRSARNLTTYTNSKAKKDACQTVSILWQRALRKLKDFIDDLDFEDRMVVLLEEVKCGALQP